jgi:hypothetical protein
MTKQEFLELYGKSVYQVYLEMAMQLRLCGKQSDDCLKEAHFFVKVLLGPDVKELKGLYD